MVHSQGRNWSGKTPACVLRHLTTLMATHTSIIEYIREQSFHLTLKKTRLGFVRVPPTERTVHVNLFCAISEASNSVPVSSNWTFNIYISRQYKTTYVNKVAMSQSSKLILKRPPFIFGKPRPCTYKRHWACRLQNETISQHAYNRDITYFHKH